MFLKMPFEGVLQRPHACMQHVTVHAQTLIKIGYNIIFFGFPPFLVTNLIFLIRTNTSLINC